MTLKSTIENIKTLASQIPNVGFVGVGDIYKLNAQQNIQYPAFIITQQEHMYDVQEDYVNLNLVFFYVDRLLEDKSNELDIQSFGMTTIQDLLNDLNYIDVPIIDNYRIDTFTERFESDCAGALAYVSLHIPTEDCEWESIFDFLYHLFEERINNKQDKLTESRYIKVDDNAVIYLTDELPDKINSNTEEIEKLKVHDIETDKKIDDLSDIVDTKANQDDLDNLIEKIEQNTNDINTNKNAINALQTDLNTLNDNLSTLNDKVSGIEENKANKEDVEELSNKVDELDEKIVDIPTKFKTINGQTIIGEGNIEIHTEGSYSEGDNISIVDGVISVTGLSNYDDSEVRELISDNTDAIGELDNAKQPKGDYALKSEIPLPYDDTAIKERLTKIEETLEGVDEFLQSL